MHLICGWNFLVVRNPLMALKWMRKSDGLIKNHETIYSMLTIFIGQKWPICPTHLLVYDMILRGEEKIIIVLFKKPSLQLFFHNEFKLPFFDCGPNKGERAPIEFQGANLLDKKALASLFFLPHFPSSSKNSYHKKERGDIY